MLKTIRQSYSRQILLNILSNASESLDDSAKALISKSSSFGKLCDLIHNDYMTSAHVNEFYGNPQILETSKEQIISLMKFMKGVPEFKSYFVKDLFTRAKMTFEKAASDNFGKLDLFSMKTLRKVMDGSPMLDPLNLLFLRDQIFELSYVEEEKLPEMIKAFFDILMAYILLFKR